MDKDRFTSLVSEPDHPIHAATAYMAMLENRKKQKATGRILALSLIVALTAAVVAVVALGYSS